MRFATRPIRVGQEPERENNSVIYPLYQTTNFAWHNLEAPPALEYTRVQNPNRRLLEEVLASLENGNHATVFASGMAAVSACFAYLKPGDQLLMATDIYGGTHRLAQTELLKYGIETSYFDAQKPESIRQVAKANAKMLIFETPTNPPLRVNDLAHIGTITRDLGITSVCDNTFASPVLQNPLDHGIDLVLHSTTKYLNGHSDVVGGAVITNRADLAEHLHTWNMNVGANPSPFDCWLTLRGLKTLSVRVDRHCENGQKVAEFLRGHSAVEVVHFPGLPSHPDHELAKKQMRGFGSMMSIVVRGSVEQAKKVALSTKIFMLAESLGGVESLIGYPTLMSHGGMTEEERVERGIPANLLRLSVGIEDADDLIEDLQHAFSAAGL
jgi:cystathionine beta-lyase/cystathionine gamma-synthase